MRCITPDRCSKMILAGEVYFCLSEKIVNRFRNYRYCIDCAQDLYPELVESTVEVSKQQAKRTAVRSQVIRAQRAKDRSNVLMRRATAPERYLWTFLCERKLGVTFYRQKPLLGFIVDFWCPEKRLVVELDGAKHHSRRAQDRSRDETLRKHAIAVVRFPARAVYYDMNTILETIRELGGLRQSAANRTGK